MNANQLKTLLTAFGLVGLMALSGCKSGGHRHGYHTYTQAWYDVYGFYCSSGQPSAGCNFYADGTKIVDYEDPYYSSGNYIEYGIWDYTDSYGYQAYYEGWAWLSPTGILYDDYGYALNENNSRRGRDLLAKAAAQERVVIQKAGAKVAERYALSSDTGVRIAQTLNDWATLAKTRSRTQADVAAFSKRLYGIDYSKIENALTEAQAGDNSGMDALVEDGAANWSTSPETMREILRNWYGQEAKDAGINL